MRHILLVEDHAPDVFLIREAIRQLGESADVEVAQTVDDALSALEQSRFELIILDLNLPGEDGFEFLRMRQGETHPPIVIFTSSDRPSDKKEALALGARDYIVKPAGFMPMIDASKAIIKRWIGSGESSSPARFSLQFAYY